jgi:hypothetical protein
MSAAPDPGAALRASLATKASELALALRGIGVLCDRASRADVAELLGLLPVLRRARRNVARLAFGLWAVVDRHADITPPVKLPALALRIAAGVPDHSADPAEGPAVVVADALVAWAAELEAAPGGPS